MGDRKPDSSDLMKLVLLPIIHSLFKILANYVTGMFLNAHCFCRERWWSADLGQGIKKGLKFRIGMGIRIIFSFIKRSTNKKLYKKIRMY